MLEKLIPLLYVLAIGFVAFRLCNATYGEHERIEGRLLVIFALLNITGYLIVGFLPFSNWAFIFIVAVAIVASAPRDPVTRISMFLFLFPILPDLGHYLYVGSIPLLWMTWPRLLTIILLFPVLLSAFSKKPPFYYPIDKFIWAFFLLNAGLAFRDANVTVGMRGVVILVIDVLAPYFVLSRYLTTTKSIRKALFSLLAAFVFAGLINVFETFRHWNLFPELTLSVTGTLFAASDRLGMLRAFGPLDRPSQSAFALATGLGLIWALSPYTSKRSLAIALVGILTLGLIFTFSRGSWFAAAIIGCGFLLASPGKQIGRVMLIVLVIAIPLSFLEITSDLIRILPFIGDQSTQAASTVTYRQQLFEASIIVAHENPVFGSSTFYDHPEFSALRHPSGFLDLVNHYILLLLTTGYAGLFAFLSIFVSAFSLLGHAVRNSTNQTVEDRILFRALLYTLIGLLIAITTTSALGRAGLILWCLVAIAAASTGTYISKSRPIERRSTRIKRPELKLTAAKDRWQHTPTSGGIG